MYWFAGTAQQIISTAKLPVLSKTLKNSIVTKCLVLTLSHTTSNHLLTIYYDCAESVVVTCSKKQIQS